MNIAQYRAAAAELYRTRVVVAMHMANHGQHVSKEQAVVLWDFLLAQSLMAITKATAIQSKAVDKALKAFTRGGLIVHEPKSKRQNEERVIHAGFLGVPPAESVVFQQERHSMRTRHPFKR